MKWIKKIFDKIFKNLYSICSGIFLSILIVLLTTMSAQYLGDVISNKVLNNKPVEILFFTNKNDQKENIYVKKIINTINNSNDLKKYRIKIKQIDANENYPLNQNGKIIFSTQKKIMDNFASLQKFTILDRSIFDSRTHEYLTYSKYDEYAIAETNDNFKIYIGILNAETSTKKVKIFKTLNAISSNILRKIDLQPDA